ncbi:hypothetical protein Hte_006978 [Hypoxylon texense]
MDSRGAAGSDSVKPTKAVIACDRCKARKRRCDGGIPKCANCLVCAAECNYAAARKYRGPGKRGKHVDTGREADTAVQLLPPPQSVDHDLSNLCATESSVAVISRPMKDQIDPSSYHEALPIPDLQSNSVYMPPSQKQSSVKNGLPIFADFLLPDQYGKHLNTIKRELGKATATRRFVPLMPYHISKRLMENTFATITGEHQLLDQPSFIALLDAQYAASPVDPADSPARWALVSAVVALAIRSKTAPGSEGCLSDIPRGYYQNAITVLPDLILQAPILLAIQALLAMALFAKNIRDRQAFVMLANNASRQLELFFTSGAVVDPNEAVSYERACGVVKMLNLEVVGSENRARTQPPILIGGRME